MAEDKPGLHIDLDWKKQAQEEKKRLEEEEKKRADDRAAAAAAPAAPAGIVPSSAGGAAPSPMTPGASGRAGARGPRGERELPPAGIPSLTQSLVTQTMYYLGDSAARAGDEASNMDMAKHLIDTLGVLEEKTQGRLDPEEQQILNTALYEARMRFIAVAGQVIAGT
ncbi:MAG: hypothetical protein JWN40_5668 [Phycisphaerales bacterium]|nr:hypothetical protein [Phycisphaerales bacterium]